MSLCKDNVVLVQVVANYYGSRQRFEMVRPIHWPGGLDRAPPDIPKCGFDGSGCPPDGKQFHSYAVTASEMKRIQNCKIIVVTKTISL